jgi:hypothetical protein
MAVTATETAFVAAAIVKMSDCCLQGIKPC